MPEDVGAIGSAVSGEESGAWAESRESGSASEHAGGFGACSSVARAPTIPEVVEGILAAIAALEAGELGLARSRLAALAATLRSAGHAGDQEGVKLP